MLHGIPRAAAGQPRNAYAYDYFISYSARNLKDAKFVESVLRGRKLRVWMQAYDSPMNGVIVKVVAEAIAQSRNFVAMLSSHFLKSDWAAQELEWFLADRLDRDYGYRHLVVIECGPVRRMSPIFKTQYRAKLHDKTGEADRKKEVIRALTRATAEERNPLNTFFDLRTPNPPDCVGRRKELMRIKGCFFPGGGADASAAHAAPAPVDARRVLIQAGPGFGKTTLAAYFARAHRGYFSGVWWIPSQDPATLLTAVMANARRSKSVRAPTPELARGALEQYFRDATAPFLLVFDNVGAPSEDAGPDRPAGPGARTAPQGTEKLVLELAGCLPTNVRVLMTSRRADWNKGAELLELRALLPETAAAFLKERAQRPRDGEGALRLAKLLDGLPLALDHAGAYCRWAQRSFDEYGKDLPELMKKTPVGVDYQPTVFATTTMSLEHARKICGHADAVTRLADFLSYCSADRIPRALCLRALDDEVEPWPTTRSERCKPSACSIASRVFRRRTMRRHPPAGADDHSHRDRSSGRSNAVIAPDALPVRKLAGAPEKTSRRRQALRLRKYMPHLFRALPHLDAPVSAARRRAICSTRCDAGRARPQTGGSRGGRRRADPGAPAARSRVLLRDRPAGGAARVCVEADGGAAESLGGVPRCLSRRGQLRASLRPCDGVGESDREAWIGLFDRRGHEAGPDAANPRSLRAGRVYAQELLLAAYPREA